MTTLQLHFPDFQLQPKRLVFVNSIEKSGSSEASVEGLDSVYVGIARQIFNDFLSRNQEMKEFFEREDRALLSIPSEETLFGDICGRLANLIKRKLTEGKIVTAEYVRDLAGIITESVCEIAQLRVSSESDFLTELPTRGAFEKRLKEEIKRSDRGSTPLSMLIFDLDKFKEVNDHGGHLAGDAALSFVGECFRNTGSGRVLRDTDFAARMGGDEFYILLPNADVEGAIIVAKRIQDAIGQKEFVYGSDANPHAFRLSSSIGISHYEGAEKDPKGLGMIGVADNCLYIMKGLRHDLGGVREERRGNIACEGRIIRPDEISALMKKNQGAQVIPFGGILDVG